MLLVPYKCFKIRTKLNREQCLQRLVDVVQPQRVIPIVSIPDSADNRLIFKVLIKSGRFYLRYIDRNRPPSRRNSFVSISGYLQDAMSGTDVMVRATFDPSYALWLGFLALSLGFFGLYAAFSVLTNPQAPQPEKVFVGISSVLTFVWFVVVHYALFTYFFAKAVTKPCEALRQVYESSP